MSEMRWEGRLAGGGWTTATEEEVTRYLEAIEEESAREAQEWSLKNPEKAAEMEATFSGALFRWLQEENKRLRSDDWLEKAAEEIARWATKIDSVTPADPRDASFVLAILKQFRDGCACGHPAHKGPCTYTSGSALPCHCLG